MLNDIRKEISKKTTTELVADLKRLHSAILVQILMGPDFSFERNRQRYIAIYEELQARKQQQKETF